MEDLQKGYVTKDHNQKWWFYIKEGVHKYSSIPIINTDFNGLTSNKWYLGLFEWETDAVSSERYTYIRIYDEA